MNDDDSDVEYQPTWVAQLAFIVGFASLFAAMAIAVWMGL